MKYYDKVIAEIEVTDNIPTPMEIINPKYFFDNYNKNVMNEEEIRQCIKDILRPKIQSGFREITDRLGVDMTRPCWYWELFKATRGLNVKEPFQSIIDKQFILDVLSPFEDIILEKKPNNSIENISDWVMRIYNKILEEFSDNM